MELPNFETCDVCGEKLSAFKMDAVDPPTFLLPCLHAFCAACIARCEKASENVSTMICVICRAEFARLQALVVPRFDALSYK
ncbi:unnamed protein product [Gongylonema pulchrum]|uniref:RING-type domain-containing protein n=1 Tax=Gongylonema pulchrum TaxID=637853 RepID=A0A183DXG1_9BILA|nr:unnamed protein product [Gongylonema pulchrum]